jgi:hypothetical protein
MVAPIASVNIMKRITRYSCRFDQVPASRLPAVVLQEMIPASPHAQQLFFLSSDKPTIGEVLLKIDIHLRTLDTDKLHAEARQCYKTDKRNNLLINLSSIIGKTLSLGGLILYSGCRVFSWVPVIIFFAGIWIHSIFCAAIKVKSENKKYHGIFVKEAEAFQDHLLSSLIK